MDVALVGAVFVGVVLVSVVLVGETVKSIGLLGLPIGMRTAGCFIRGGVGVAIFGNAVLGGLCSCGCIGFARLPLGGPAIGSGEVVNCWDCVCEK